MGKRKRWLAALLALTLFLPTAALADDVGEYSTLRAYWALVGNQTAGPAVSGRISCSPGL